MSVGICLFINCYAPHRDGRLDRLVSGVLILARSTEAAAQLQEHLKQQLVEKEYLARVKVSSTVLRAGLLIVIACSAEAIDQSKTNPSRQLPHLK